VAKALQAADNSLEMIGFIALGIVMLIWVLTWEREDVAEPAASDHRRAEDPRLAH
jgi:hypothetical protein